MKKKVLLISGGSGRLASEFRTQGGESGHDVICLGLDRMDITDISSVERAITDHKPDVFIHCAAILDGSRIPLALETNIVGTVNVVIACMEHHVKLIYLSTDYVYSKEQSCHTENDPLLPATSYAWTKLGGECAVRTYSNSLIIRGALCPRPYPHKHAYTDVKKNMIYQGDAAGYILQLLDETGVVNLGESELGSLYDFAMRTREDVIPIISPPEYEPKLSYLCVDKLKCLLQNKLKKYPEIK